MWVTRAALWQVAHACRRGCGHLPFLTKLGLYLGLRHLQLQTTHRLLDHLASSLQWSEPCSVGKLFHRGSGGLPLGTMTPLFSRNLNIKLLPFSLPFWGLLSQPIIYLVQSSTTSQKAVTFCSAILSCFKTPEIVCSFRSVRFPLLSCTFMEFS